MFGDHLILSLINMFTQMCSLENTFHTSNWIRINCVLCIMNEVDLSLNVFDLSNNLYHSMSHNESYYESVFRCSHLCYTKCKG